MAKNIATILKDRITSGILPVGLPLPSVRALALEYEVSLVTMQKALRQLAVAGYVRIMHGKGCSVLSKDTTDIGEAIELTDTLWRTVSHRIQCDILQGVYNRTGMLPASKEMQILYGANYRTLKRALDTLKIENMITPYHRGYRLISSIRSSGQNELLVFLHSTKGDLNLSYIDPHLLRHIETLCQQAKCMVTFVRISQNAQSTHYTNHTTGQAWSSSKTNNLLGSMWIVIYPNEIIPDVCHTLLRTQKPVSVYGGGDAYPDFFISNKLVKFFANTVGQHSFSVIGNYLTRTKHTHAAFFSTMFSKEWAIKGLDLTKKLFAAAGYPNGVTAFTAEHPHSPGNMDELSRQFAQHIILGAVNREDALEKELLSRILYRNMESDLSHNYYVWRVAVTLEPLLTKALALPDITAWIFTEDDEAIIGLDFLKRNNVPVPKKISVIANNNTLAALKANLTSYTSNVESVVNAMFNYLVYPNLLGNQIKKKTISSINGYLVERASTAR